MAGEFKIKTGLILGPSPTQPVLNITNASSFFNTDASSSLATVKSIYDFVGSSISPLATNASLSASITNAWEGLTKTDNSIGLGGIIYNNTTIDISDGYALRIKASYGENSIDNFYDAWLQQYSNTRYLDPSLYAASYIIMDEYSLRLQSQGPKSIYVGSNPSTRALIEIAHGLSGAGPGIRISYDSSATITDYSPIKKGIIYTADYSNTFINESLITKRFVINTLGASLGAYATNASVNLALEAYATNASVNLAFLTNASLGNLTVSVNTLNSSLFTLTSRHNVTEVSLGLLTTRVSGIETSLGAYATNASISNANFAKNASLSLYVQKAGDTMTGALNINASLNVVGVMTLNGAGIAQHTLNVYPYAGDSQAVIGIVRNLGTQNAVLGLITNGANSPTNVNWSLAMLANTNNFSISSWDGTSSIERLSVTNAGNVGINSTLPGYKFEVGGSVKIDGSVNLNNQRIIGLATPINSSDATNKWYVDTSLLAYATNVSVNLALGPYATNASVGLAIAPFATNASVGLALGAYTTNTSANTALSQFIRSTSTGSTIKWAAGLFDVSDYISKTSIDASFASFQTAGDARWIDINRMGLMNQTETSLGFNPTDYVFTLSKTGASWKYLRYGIEYTINQDVSVQIGNPPAKGTYFIYIDDNIGTLTSSTIVWTLQDGKLPVALILWDASTVDSSTYWIADERHTCLIDRREHWYNHVTRGTQYVNGGVLDGPTLASQTNQGVTFGVSQTIIADEDIILTLPALTRPDGSTATYTIFYRTDSSTWAWRDSSVPYLFGAGSYISWDNNGVLTTGVNSDYYNYYLLFSDLGGRARYGLFPGRGDYASLAAAQAESVVEFSFTNFPIVESLIAYQLTYTTSNSYNNLGKARLAATPVRIRASSISTVGSGVSTDHNTLAGLQGGTAGQYNHLTNAEYAALSSYATNVSVNNAFLTNASLGNLTISVNTLNSSLNTLLGRHNVTEVSLGLITTRVSDIETSLGAYATNSSVNSALFTTNASFANYLKKTTDTFTGVLTINGSISLFGDFYQNGSTYVTHAEQIYTTKDFIIMRDGAVTALADGSISGLRIIKPNGTNDVLLGTGNDAVLRVGWDTSSLVAVAGREDNPVNGYYAYWDDSSVIFKTRDLQGNINASLGLYVQKSGDIMTGTLFNSSTGFGLDISGNIRLKKDIYTAEVSSNTKIGIESLKNILPFPGYYDMTAIGYKALYSFTGSEDSYGHTAVGAYALESNLWGLYNTALGAESLRYNLSNWNIGVGVRALSRSSGSLNTAVGNEALFYGGGQGNIALGNVALRECSIGDQNIAIGTNAGRYTINSSSNISSTGNIYIGYNTKTLDDGQSNEIVIGYNAKGLGTASVVLGSEYITKTLLRGNVGINEPDPISTLDVSGNVSFDGSLNMNNQTILNVAWPVNASDAVNKLYVDSCLGGFVSNASIGLALGAYATNASVGLAIAPFATNASVGLAIAPYATNTSVGLALGAYATNVSVNNAFLTNASLGNLTVSVNTLNSSLNTLLGRHNVTETSLGLITSRVSGIETSLGAYATNASVGLAIAPFATNASVGLALGAYATNVSVNNAFLTNTSLGNLTVSVNTLNSSLNTLLGRHNVTETSLGLLTTRVSGIETSLGAYATNTSVNIALSNYLTGSGSTNKVAFFDASKNLTYNSTFIWNGSSLLIGDPMLFDANNPAKLYVYQEASTFNLAAFSGNIDTYLQVKIHNESTGTAASGDFVVEADNATETTNYVDLGINNSQYDSGYVGNANDAYLYSAGKNLLIGNIGTDASDHDIVFFSGGSDVYANERMRVTATGRLEINNPASHVYQIEAGGDVNVPFGSTYRIDGIDIGIVDVTKAYVDGSLARFIRSASTGFGLYWNAGLLDVSIATGGTGMQTVETSANITVSSNYNVLVNSSYNTVSITLPASPTNGDVIQVIDVAKNASTYNITLLRNGHNINKVAQDFTIDTNGGSIALIYHSLNNNFAITNLETLDVFSSGAGVSQAYVDGSLSNIRATYIPEVSLNDSYFKWVGGLLEPSVASAGNFVPYSGATADVSLGTHSLSTEAINFSLTPTITRKEGQLFYDPANETLNFHTAGDVTLQLCQEQVIRCFNNMPSPIPSGKVVYITGYQSADIPTVDLAQADIIITSRALGVTTQEIPVGDYGFVTTGGIVHDVSTQDYTSNDILYLSDTLAGEFTNTAVTAPSIWTRIATVVESGPNGSILINVQSGRSITTLYDVGIVSPALNDVLSWNGTDWINAPVGTVSAGAGQTYFLSSSDNTIPGYETMWLSPHDTTEIIDYKVVNSSTFLLIDAYASEPSSGLGGTQIDGGIWEFNTFASVSNVTGISQIKTYVYSRSISGVETSLFNVTTGEINTTVPALFTVSSVQPTFTINSSDRLIAKYYAYTDSSTDVSINLYHGGTTYYTHIHTPLTLRHNDLAGIQGGLTNQYFHVNQAQLTVIENTSGVNTGNQDLTPYATNASVNNAFTTVNASINNIRTYLPKDIGIVIDGGGTTITTGSKGFREIDGNYDVSTWTILADASGSIVVDVKVSSYATWPGTVSIAGSEKPTLSTAWKNQDLSLTTWSRSVSTGDIIEFNVDSATTVKKVWLFLKLVPR